MRDDDNDDDVDIKPEPPEPPETPEPPEGLVFSPALLRIIEEVRLKKGVSPGGYDRVYSRHNR